MTSLRKMFPGSGIGNNSKHSTQSRLCSVASLSLKYMIWNSLHESNVMLPVLPQVAYSLRSTKMVYGVRTMSSLGSKLLRYQLLLLNYQALIRSLRSNSENGSCLSSCVNVRLSEHRQQSCSLSIPLSLYSLT